MDESEFLIKIDNQLSKDFIQHYIGLDIGDFEQKKKEFIKLLNEVRKIEGKSPKQLK